MSAPSRFSRALSLTLFAVATLLSTPSCHDSTTPTGPGNATIMGTVIRGSGTFGARPQGAIPLSQVMVRVVATGQTAQTDGSGDFTLSGAPSGNTELEFTRSDFDARGSVLLASGTNQITAAIAGSTAVITARGHAGEEIEGRVQSVNAGAGSLVVLDQRLGAVTVTTSGTTIIRRGNTTIPLSSIVAGTSVHVKAMLQSDSTYLATEILLQDENVGGQREVEGTVAMVGSNSFVVTTAAGPITVRTDSSTTFKKKGVSATLSDVVTGAMVEAEGTLQSDGSILARKVTIE